MTLANTKRRLAPYYYRAERALIAAGLWPGGKQYRRFVMLGRSRTGTTMLITALDRHTQALTYGEIFQDAGQVRWSARMGTKPRAVTAASAWPFVEQNVFRAYPAGIRAVGFKIFYYHAQEGAWSTVWDAMQADRNLFFIHVKRRNLLDMLVSRHFAQLRDKWVGKAGGPTAAPSTKQVVLSYDECLETFTETEAYYEQSAQVFAHHPLLEVHYEDMADDFEAQSRRVQAFLGLDYEDITPATRKQARRPLPERLANFDELQRQFAGSPWAAFFEE